MTQQLVVKRLQQVMRVNVPGPVSTGARAAGACQRNSMVRLTTIKPRLSPPQGRKLSTAGGSWRDGKTTNERGYTYAWQKARERFLRANPLCCYCTRDGRVTAAAVVDHKVPHNGDQQLFWNEENWQPLCKQHHDAEKQREERRQVSGR